MGIMGDNVLDTLQKLIQDVIAPDVRELKVRLTSFEKETDQRFGSLEKRMAERFDAVDQRFESLEKRMAERFDAVDRRFQAMEKQMESQTRILLSAIGELKATSELAALREISDLRERVAVLESQRH